jgi:hypothetical protein
MRTVLLLVTFGLVLPSLVHAAPGDVAAYCRQRADGSYSAEAYCVDREREASARITARGAIEPRIWEYCNARSESWSALDYCVRREEEAKARLGR